MNGKRDPENGESPSGLQGEYEAHVGRIIRRIGLVRLRKHGAAERDRGGVAGIDEPLDRLDTLRSKVDQHRLDEVQGQSRSLLIGANGGHHQISVSRHGTTIGTNETHVSRDGDGFTVLLHHDDLSIFVGGIGIGSPAKEPGHDLGDLSDPRGRSVSHVERVQSLGVALGRVTQDHESMTVIDEIGPFGSHVFLPVDRGARRPR